MRGQWMKTGRSRLAIVPFCLALCLVLPSASSAAAPQWSLSLSAFPSSFSPGAGGNAGEGPGYRVIATNNGDGPTTAPFTITDVLPVGVTAVAGEVSGKDEKGNPLSCEVKGREVSCTGTEAIAAGLAAEMIVPVEIATGISDKSVFDEATVAGGGAALAKATLRTAIGLPAWRLVAMAVPTYIEAGSDKGQIFVQAVNVGGAVTHGPVTITDTLPVGMLPSEVKQWPGPCTIETATRTVTCTTNEALTPGSPFELNIFVETEPTASGTPVNEVTIQGGAAAPAETATPVTISPGISPFGFLAGEGGFSAALLSADGAVDTQAGSHPEQLDVEIALPSQKPTDLPKGNSGETLAAGTVRDIVTDLPPGQIINPNSTTARCTQDQFVSRKCPDASQIGVGTVVTASINGFLNPVQSPLFNLVPTPGTPSTFGFDAAGVGIWVHVAGHLRSDGDYGLSGLSTEILGRGPNPLLGIRLALWGDPSSSSHDKQRGNCLGGEGKFCPAEEETKTALLTAPVQCTGRPTVTHARADTWEETGNYKSASYESADLAGNPVAISGCNQLQFQPTIEAKPTTNLADSPSGLDVSIHQPTNEDPGGTSPAVMKDLRLVLPAGMSVNPSSADGLGACSEALANVHTLDPSACPADSKLGSVEVRTPLLDHPLPGALYLAKPFENPSGSLVALYLAIDDPATGTVSNLAGRAELDPGTGQLTTIFEENPQLPLEDITTHLFTGARAAFRTPPTCGTYSSSADITPWSSPQTADAHPTDSFAISTSPLGGSCPTAAGAVPNSPSFTAGTLSPQAGAYSPFVLHLNRPDGTAEPQRIQTTLPPGLLAKLAGVSYCSDAQIEAARLRERPDGGALERAAPSCPASSLLGTVDVAAGAGPTPLHTPGRAYLAGPYKGAPLSLVVITPAIAGPFDLGAVVLRTALQIDPASAQVTAVSDPLPRIIEGIPLDIRGITIELNRSQLTLNPTSCDPFAITGTLTSVGGSATALNSHFQVGNCSALGFKPKLALRLKGSVKRSSNPTLIANLTARPGDANIARAQVKLPHPVFLDQAHIRTVCTRVQFAADACPAGSVYGKVSATTPLVGYPLTGSVYLRSSSHALPDLVAKLQGPAYQPIEIDLDGRTDAVKAALRNTFEAVPDAPVSTFRLELFGGKRGLVEMSSGFCASRKATVQLDAQNGKVWDTTPVVAAKCPKTQKPKKAAKKQHKKSGNAR
jgi:hypothetical protein